MKKIGIIGGGFSGTMLAVHLVEKADSPLEIILINEKQTLHRGIAYSPYSDKHLLNVVASRMSAFAERENHFLDWVIDNTDILNKDKSLIAGSFLPRKIYGDYLCAIWENTVKTATRKGISLKVENAEVTQLEKAGERVDLSLFGGKVLRVDYCVIASGNLLPGNPNIKNKSFFTSPNYFQNPWRLASVQNLNNDLPVLIIGNGLTMVDTVLGLLENGFKGEIYSISPNGFNILPHRHSGEKYTHLVEELHDDLTLLDLVKLVNKHIKRVRTYGISAEPVIDSMRPYTQIIWKRFTVKEKKLFMARLRHLWGVARHRIPLHTHDSIQQLRIENKLMIKAGKIIAIAEDASGITVSYFDKKDHTARQLKVGRVINCTGPQTNLEHIDNHFLKTCLNQGMIKQDALKLGISTNPDTFQVISATGEPHQNIFTLGSTLKGELWETTAVNELRVQTERLAERLVDLES